MPQKQKPAFQIPTGYSSVHVLCDTNTFKHCYNRIAHSLPAHQMIRVPSGEKSKTLANCERIWQHLLKHKADRNALLINLGGGMICDLGGFAAAGYKRGINFINIPTSLLGMVDAGFGGKTGINFGDVKNSVGVFANPLQFILDHEFLKTLPHREYRSGMAEVIKHAIVYDRQLFQQIIQLKPREELSGDMIVKAAEIKTKIVRKDPFEKDIRKILNFGHTIGHAIEALALQKGKPMLHGEAVATGMCFEAMIAHEKQMLSLKTRGEILNCISLHCQTRFEIADEFPQLLALMQNDKKNSSTEIRMALPTRIGKCDYDVSVGVSEIKTVLREFAAAK